MRNPSKKRRLSKIDEETESQLFRDVALVALLDRLSSGQKLNLKVQDNAAALIKEGQELKTRAATAQAVSVSTGLESRVYQNLQGSFQKDKQFKSITVNVANSTYTVNDEAGFIAEIREKYQSNFPVQSMHPYIEDKLRKIVRLAKPISTHAGIPALHAEVRALNDILCQISPNRMPTPQQLADIQVSTYKLGNASYGSRKEELTNLEPSTDSPQKWLLFNPFTKLQRANRVPNEQTRGMKFAEWAKEETPNTRKRGKPGIRRPGTPGGQFPACTNCQIFLEIPEVLTGKLLVSEFKAN